MRVRIFLNVIGWIVSAVQLSQHLNITIMRAGSRNSCKSGKAMEATGQRSQPINVQSFTLHFHRRILTIIIIFLLLNKKLKQLRGPIRYATRYSATRQFFSTTCIYYVLLR